MKKRDPLTLDQMWDFESDHNFREKYLLINLPERISSNVTPERLARVFSEMNSESMAIFFNQLADIEKEWRKKGGMGWPMQLQYVTDEAILEQPARYLMSLIGEYSAKDCTKHDESKDCTHYDEHEIFTGRP